MSQENVERIRAGFEAHNRGDVDALVEVYDPDAVFETLLLGTHHGNQAIRLIYEENQKTLSGYDVVPVELIDAGDTVVAVAQAVGAGPVSDIAVDDHFAFVFTFKGDRVVREQAFRNREEALEAAGLSGVGSVRRCGDDERAAILEIVNAAAEAYRGVIPEDRWHEPYMPADELDEEIAAGVEFWGYEADGDLVGIMGIQQVRDVDLIRHAYVVPSRQGQGVGGEVLEHLVRLAQRPMLVGTWAAAEWAIRFYQHHGFELTSTEEKTRLLKTYWNIPERQVQTSVVLAYRVLPGRGAQVS